MPGAKKWFMEHTVGKVDEIIHSLDKFALSGSKDDHPSPPPTPTRPKQPRPRAEDFVGGFNPGYTPRNPLPTPPKKQFSFPTPVVGRDHGDYRTQRPEMQTLCMWFSFLPLIYSRLDTLAPVAALDIARPVSTSAVRLQPFTPVQTPRRSASVPPSPSSSSSAIQCSGITKSNKRCTRPVKISPALASLATYGDEIERYCFQHKQELLQQSGYHSRNKSGAFVDFKCRLTFLFLYTEIFNTAQLIYQSTYNLKRGLH
jgi:hypothetical protein